MKVVIMYDISLIDNGGAKRLEKIRKICMRWGVPVQKSVYELDVNNMQFENIKIEICKVIDMSIDNVRMYILGNSFEQKILSFGMSNKNDLKNKYIF